jgi:hypothetical protein
MEEHNHHEHYPHYHAWKWVVGILIVLAAFGAGFVCGRFSAFFGGYGYGYPMGPGMMYGAYGYPYGYSPAQSQAGPENATTTPAPYYYYPMGGMMGGYYYPQQATSTR